MLHASRSTKVTPARIEGVVVLDFDARQRHRFLTRLEGGGELAVELARGTVLADGDFLETAPGCAVLVRAADEELSVVRIAEPLLLSRVAYHLGNRHVALQIEHGSLKYRHDHVLDDLVRRLGAVVDFEHAPFSPEGGAYGRGGHHEHRGHHHHGASHDHEHPPAAHGHGAHGHARGEHEHGHDPPEGR